MIKAKLPNINHRKEYLKNRRTIAKYFRNLSKEIATSKHLQSVEIYMTPVKCPYFGSKEVVNAGIRGQQANLTIKINKSWIPMI